VKWEMERYLLLRLRTVSEYVPVKKEGKQFKSRAV